jgi:L-fuconolactonase
MPIIDAHQHFWQLNRGAPYDYSWLEKPAAAKIRRDFLPADLKPLLDAVGVTHTVFVQTQHHLDENRWVLGLADAHPWIVGVVGWVDLASPRVAEQVEEFKSHPKFVGVRHITQDEPDDDFIVRPDVLRGLKTLERLGVPFDLLFYVKHLKHAVTVAKAVPTLPLVVDHLAKPRIKDHAFDDWLPHLAAAAKMPNVYCKLSGLVTEADHANWQVADLRPYVEQALELFGPARCMYGSDWPVCELASSYRRVFEAMQEITRSLTAAERESIFSGTATKFYGLKL